MNQGAFAFLLVAAAFAVTYAQKYPDFPFHGCKQVPTSYSLLPIVNSKGFSTYCFTVKVDTPPDCTDDCCTRADLKKVELNVYEKCDSYAATVNATVNGVPTLVRPSFDTAKDGPPGATILRVTQLGLGLSDSGAEICITLSSRKPGLGCSTIEDLCVPPEGSPPGVCSAVLFDSTLSCCPLSTVRAANPPPPFAPSASQGPNAPSPLVPSSPPLPPPPTVIPPATPCTVCAYLVLSSVKPIFPVAILEDQCKAWAAAVSADVANQTRSLNISMISGPPRVICQSLSVKVCSALAREDAAAKLQPWLESQVLVWLQLVTLTPTVCPAHLNGYHVSVTVAGDGEPAAPPPSCLSARTELACVAQTVPFPQCTCNTQMFSTPFAAYPFIDKMRSPRSNKTDLYCFTTSSMAKSSEPDSPCAQTTVLLKAEIWANDSYKHKVEGIAVQPNGADDFTFLASTWGRKGENTLKATPLLWSKREANNGRICLELEKTLTLKQLCNTGVDTCWINFFDPTRQCCPLYSATFIP